jgi:hypothetical protein
MATRSPNPGRLSTPLAVSLVLSTVLPLVLDALGVGGVIWRKKHRPAAVPGDRRECRS